MADAIGQILLVGILFTPIIAFFLARRMKSSTYGEKVVACILFTAFLALLFFIVAMGILMRDGLGPT
jgi:hypothetical protein